MTAQSTGAPAKRVRVIAASDLKQNGGGYVLEGRIPLAVYGVSEGETKAQGGQYPVEGNIPVAVYIVEAPDGVVTGNVPVPMIAIEGGLVAGNTAIPVYVVGGSLGGLDPVTNLALVIGNSPANNEIDVSWDAVTGATLYRIRYSTNGADWTEIDTTALTTHTLTGSEYDVDAVTHYIEVRAENGSGESEWVQAMMSGLLIGLVAYWELDEASGNRADSVGGNTLVDNSAVGSDTGKVTALAAAFNNDYLLLASPSASLNFAGDFTVGGWVRVDSFSGGHILDRRATGNWSISASTSNSGCIRWAMGTGGDQNGSTKSVDTWYHILMENDGGAGRGYVDNTQEATAAASFTHTGAITFGDFNAGSGAPFLGRMNGWGAWARVLSTAQKADFYNGGTGKAYPFS